MTSKLPHYLCLLFCLITFLNPSHAQDEVATRELGILMTSTNNFGVVYKKSKGENFRRYGAQASIRYADNQNYELQFSSNFSIGFEKRKSMTDKMQFIHGWQPFIGLLINDSNQGINLFTNLGIGYILGMQIDVGKNFYVGAEINPSFNILLNLGPNEFNHFTQIGLNSNSDFASIFGVYRF